VVEGVSSSVAAVAASGNISCVKAMKMQRINPITGVVRMTFLPAFFIKFQITVIILSARRIPNNSEITLSIYAIDLPSLIFFQL
jgi:hypothetical protein